MTKPVFDDDNPEWTEEDFAEAKPLDELLPPEIAAQFKRSPGRPIGSRKADRKQPVNLRLDPDVLAYFRSGGPGWQSRINAALRVAMGKAA